MTTDPDVTLAQFKSAQRRMWQEGDYRQVADRLESAAHQLVADAHVRAGQRVLDVATGSGSVAISAARAGATVVALDHTDAWFDDARRRARAAAVDVALHVGDAEQLPVAPASFDVVLSSFGAIFAPRHDVVAAELARVCRPGGTVALTAWTAGGGGDRLISVILDQLPDAPAFASPSIQWGDPDYVRGLFAAHRVTVAFRRSSLVWEFPSVDAAETFLFDASGPLMAARRTLQAQGRWEATHAAMRAAMHANNDADDGTCRFTFDFLIAVGTKAP